MARSVVLMPAHVGMHVPMALLLDSGVRQNDATATALDVETVASPVADGLGSLSWFAVPPG